jgi:hypothetical protein
MKSMTVQQIFQILEDLGFVPSNRQDDFYFTHNGRKTQWTDTMEFLGVGPISHLFLKLIVPGGAPQNKVRTTKSVQFFSSLLPLIPGEKKSIVR